MTNSLSTKSIIRLATIMVLVLAALAGCAPQTTDVGNAAEGQGKSTAETITVEWSFEGDCGICHSNEMATLSDAALCASVHQNEATAQCISCHTDEATLEKVHDGKTADDKPAKRLKKTSVLAETCQSAGCHDLSPEEMIEKASGYEGLVDANGTRVNAHEVMTLTPGHAETTCISCHSMHKPTVDAASTCVACHHAGVYECNTCH